ncbi:hypothetical protein D3C76_290320 [compost metagenome]
MFKKLLAVCIGLLVILLLQIGNESRAVWNSEFYDSGNEADTNFLSNDYFNELDELFEQVKLHNDKWYIFDGSNTIAAKAVITKLMKDLEHNPTALHKHKNFELYFETFDKNIRRLNSITEEMHFFRNILNSYSDAPESLDEMITLAAKDKWKLFSARYHRYNYEGVNGALNVKFMSANGRFEAVYNTGTGEIVTDSYNMGTYNYAPGSINPKKYYKHYLLDKKPWEKWGNADGVTYKDIMKLKSGHGSAEEKENTRKIKKWIERRKEELMLNVEKNK